ncbi:MAG: GGDEF domain-containing protein [Burkholderiaceae bacterium]
MRALTQADIVCDKARLFAKSIERAAKEECDAKIKDVALQLAQARIHELEEKLAQMSKLAHEDALTGILNRRGSEAAFARELSRCRRQKTSLCVALLDIDNFKRINDEYGHATGDAALVHFARIVGSAMRTSDIFARIGGEEFLLILPDTEPQQAEHTMMRVQKTLASAALRIGHAELSLTFSVGIAQFQPEDVAERLIDRADFSVRSAKQKGKNCIVCG